MLAGVIQLSSKLRVKNYQQNYSIKQRKKKFHWTFNIWKPSETNRKRAISAEMEGRKIENAKTFIKFVGFIVFVICGEMRHI